ncbi:MAG: L-proline---[L-prolyl-carrier protein] ligase [Actinomycetota bacterium]|nr:L-proline---[L-prolyl-carrier protein] ligase [Actinomycetota bacterium]
MIEAARRAPERTAVVDRNGPMSYRELDRRADAVAGLLARVGVGRSDRVIVHGDKSADVVAALQGVLRLGAVYIPLDAQTPPARIRMVIEDARAAAVLSDRPQALSEILAGAPPVPCLDLLTDDLLTDPASLGACPAVEAKVSADDPAYILYTSGSTGRPKGVCLSHGNALAFVEWAAAEVGVRPQDRLANHSSFTFDMSVLDLYVAFAGAASVHIVPTEGAFAPRLLTDFLYDQKISVWFSVPSALTLMMREGGLLDRPAPRELRTVIFAGEPFPLEQVRTLAEWTDAELLNLYGPTETNVCTRHRVTAEDLSGDRPLPIGTAVCADTVWAEHPDGTPAGPGEEGELVVEGPTVMLGYWGREPQRGPYRTGDIVRVLPDGAFTFVGRRDHQTKIRGFRVELGEVERGFTSHPDVAVAVAVTTDSGAAARLVVFVLPETGRSPGPLAMRSHAAQRLPRYMLPHEVHVLGDIPITPNGKTDRRALQRRAASAAKTEEGRTAE